jgi:hypothetical protein
MTAIAARTLFYSRFVTAFKASRALAFCLKSLYATRHTSQQSKYARG